MAATIDIKEYNGTSGSQAATTKTGGSIRYKTADNATVDNNNVLTVPVSGSNFSVQKYHAAYMTAAPNTQVSNIRFYTAGSTNWSSGVNWWWLTSQATSYATPATPTSTTGYTNGTTYTSASPYTTGSGTYTPSNLNAVLGNYLVSMVEVQSTATSGTQTANTLTLSWDEI